jgi:hypothetical protein
MKIILFLLLPITAQAQSVGIGYSFKAWGQTEKTTEINVSHNNLTFHYFHNFDTDKHIHGTIWQINKKTSAFGVSYTPLKIWNIKAGGIVTNNRFPSNQDTYANFIIKFKIPIKGISINYTHISNGFGLFYNHNLGIDTFSVSVNF